MDTETVARANPDTDHSGADVMFTLLCARDALAWQGALHDAIAYVAKAEDEHERHRARLIEKLTKIAGYLSDEAQASIEQAARELGTELGADA